MNFLNNVVVVDLETSGLDPDMHGILEIGGYHFPTGFEFVQRIHLKDHLHYNQEVFAVNGISEIEARNPEGKATEEEAMGQFFDWLLGLPRPGTDLYMAGSNPKFDHDFLAASNDNAAHLAWPFRRHLLDLQTTAVTHFLANGIAVPSSLSADSIYPLIGMEPEPRPHRAIQGARWEADAFRRMWRTK